MKLCARPGILTDFDAFFHGFYDKQRTDVHLCRILEHEWRVFLACSRRLTMIVEDTDRAIGDQMVGIAQTVFVTDAFVEYAKASLDPHINIYASYPMPDGSIPLLTPAEIGEANAGAGLNALTTRWGWRETISKAEQRQVRAFLDRTYPPLYRGHCFKYLMMPAYGGFALSGLMHAGYRLLSDYAPYYRNNPPVPSDNEHPYLLGVSRDEAEGQEGTFVSRIFDYIPPRFFFKPREQELLWWALLGLGDERAGDQMCVGLQAVKKRWEAIYERVQTIDPGLLPEGRSGARGAEKKGPLLHYLRDHLEEIRPIVAREATVTGDV